MRSTRILVGATVMKRCSRRSRSTARRAVYSQRWLRARKRSKKRREAQSQDDCQYIDRRYGDRVTDEVHPENVFLFERIAKIIGLDIAGVDVMATSQ